MISVEQNTQKQLLRLAAQRQQYAKAKLLFGWQIILGGPVTVLVAFTALSVPQIKVYAAALGITLVLLDVFLFTPWQKKLRASAARVQEAFDCDVLQLPWNDIKVGTATDLEEVKKNSELYKSWAHQMPTLKDWYPKVVDELPVYIARLVCQRSNCWWDSSQRRRYANWLIFAVAFVFAVICGTALLRGETVETLLLAGIAPLAPAFWIGLRQSIEQREAADRLDKLKEHCQKSWRQALAGESEGVLTINSRTIQDEIYDNRRKTPPVMDFLFKRLRGPYEKEMNYAAEQMVVEAKAAMKNR